jgi:hypothetical protein
MLQKALTLVYSAVYYILQADGPTQQLGIDRGTGKPGEKIIYP